MGLEAKIVSTIGYLHVTRSINQSLVANCRIVTYVNAPKSFREAASSSAHYGIELLFALLVLHLIDGGKAPGWPLAVGDISVIGTGCFSCDSCLPLDLLEVLLCQSFSFV